MLKNISFGIVGVVVGLLLGINAGNGTGGVYEQVNKEFYEGLKAGLLNEFTVSNGGDITTSGATDVSTFTQGGGVYSTSTPTNSTLLAEAFDTENVIEMTLTGGAGTLTFPATSSLTSFIPNTGDTRSVWIRNASTSVNAILTVAAGTGMTFKNAASSTVLLVGDTDGDNTMRLDFIRKSDTDINVYLQKYQD